MLTPHDLGFPESFSSFRVAQEQAIDHALTSEKRFTGIGAPPGCGKSGIAVALARLLGGRTIILTSNLGLERQYLETFASMAMVGIRGRSNYPCWSSGTCEDGARFGCGDKIGCPYLCAFKAQQDSEIVVTNYAYWLAVHEKAQGIKPADTLILDEAGLADGWLSRALDFTISERECREGGLRLVSASSGPPGEQLDVWKKLADRIQTAALFLYERKKADALKLYTDRAKRELKHAEQFHDRANRLTRLDDNWVITRDDGTDDGRIWKFECIWPGHYREKLFRGISRVILLSATLRPKTLSLLGIPRSECDFREWPRQFPAANGPVVWVPTAAMNHRMSGEDEQRWLKRIGEIGEWGNDRKGIIHTVSYARAKKIASAGVVKESRLVLNGEADPESATGRQAYERFIRSPTGSVLISPSFGTGWDFAKKHAEWQVISKIAFPDMRGKVMQARQEQDKSYPMYLAGQDIVQSCGRINRSDDDRGTTLIIDNAWAWFRQAGAEHLPAWFRVRKEDELPKPLEKL